MSHSDLVPLVNMWPQPLLKSATHLSTKSYSWGERLFFKQFSKKMCWKHLGNFIWATKGLTIVLRPVPILDPSNHLVRPIQFNFSQTQEPDIWPQRPTHLLLCWYRSLYEGWFFRGVSHPVGGWHLLHEQVGVGDMGFPHGGANLPWAQSKRYVHYTPRLRKSLSPDVFMNTTNDFVCWAGQELLTFVKFVATRVLQQV